MPSQNVSKPRRIPATRLKKLKHDPEATAAVADLVYVSDTDTGIQRKETRNGFRYFLQTKEIADAPTLARIRNIVIPPAWKNVWICPVGNGHLQATGTDARGRKQYRYHPRWNALRNSTKFHHLLLFGKALPLIRARVQKDLSLPGLPKEKLLAALVEILQLTGIRVGNEAYEKLYGSFGLTTLRNKHVKRNGSHLTFSFKGKKGIYQNVRLRSRKLSAIVQKCLDIPGKELFQYLDEHGSRHSIDSGALNAYIHEAIGGHFTAKDFRTWQGTLQALESLRTLGCCDEEKETKSRITSMLKTVAEKLGNTATVCRKYYVHPLLLTLYSEGKLAAYLEKSHAPISETDLREEEALLLSILEEGAGVIVLEE